MPDSESQRPLTTVVKQNGNAPHDHNMEQIEMTPQTQAERSPNALITSALVGVICAVASAALNVIITLFSAPVFSAVAQEGSSTVTGNTYIAAGIGILTFLISVLACYIAGSVVGRTVLKR